MKHSTVPWLAHLRKLPRDFYLDMRIEVDKEDHEYLCACLFQVPPEDGWTSRAAYFGHADALTAEEEDFPWKFDDRCLVGITCDPKDHKTFVKLLTGMLKSEVERRK